MKVSSTAKFVGTSSRKIGLVAELIRGQIVATAQITLANTNKRATDPVGKALNSALANAQNNHNLKKGELVVESVLVGPGPTLKRFRPRARGAAGAIKKRTSHIAVILADKAKTAPTKEAPKATDTKQTETKPKAEKK